MSQKILDEYYDRIDLSELIHEIRERSLSQISKSEITPKSTQTEVSQQEKDNISIITRLYYYAFPWIIFSFLTATLIYTSPSLNPIFTNFLSYLSAKVYYYLGVNMMSFSPVILISLALPIVIVVISVIGLYPRLIKPYAHTNLAEASSKNQVISNEKNYKPLFSDQLITFKSSLNDLCEIDKTLKNEYKSKNEPHKNILPIT